VRNSVPKTKKDKLILLQTFLNLETGKLNTESFDYENSLYNKAVQKKALDARIRNCSLCPGLNIKRFTEACPGWGDLNARVFFIGQSLHKPGVASDIPFILGCGYLIDAALRLSGLLRKEAFFSNCLHCHPERNRPSTDKEKGNCLQYLLREILIIQPALVVALGNDAKWAKERLSRELSGFKTLCLKHPAFLLHSGSGGKIDPEAGKDWILRLSKEIDKVYKDENKV